MKLNRLIPMLPVKSMPTSVEFYLKLGFSVEKRLPSSSTCRTFIGRAPPDSPVGTAVQKKHVSADLTSSLILATASGPRRSSRLSSGWLRLIESMRGEASTRRATGRRPARKSLDCWSWTSATSHSGDETRGTAAGPVRNAIPSGG